MHAINSSRIAGHLSTSISSPQLQPNKPPITNLLFGKAISAFKQKTCFAHSNQGDVFVKNCKPSFTGNSTEPSSFAEWYYSPEVYDNCFLNIDS